eukprot:gnl/MRDRNA2_/MRDRNA2_152027_c0_seq1.p1 gnl/MRDRNA2_/MRDRNA2_152027_c0~~gnl/MRDRNA2_/MRDRNA2_152027_c0_seq1.p1  ORF type:complete len:126 (+),score=17.06 gnl/MRDRNA2_/MRDRNA2_152027_c0_seq1:113-490(+)
MVDRYLVILLVALAVRNLYTYLPLGTPVSSQVWRDNLDEELYMADNLLRLAKESGIKKMAKGRLLEFALENLRTRVKRIRSELKKYEELHWLQKYIYNVAAFQEHADWIHRWQLEWIGNRIMLDV